MLLVFRGVYELVGVHNAKHDALAAVSYVSKLVNASAAYGLYKI